MADDVGLLIDTDLRGLDMVEEDPHEWAKKAVPKFLEHIKRAVAREYARLALELWQ